MATATRIDQVVAVCSMCGTKYTREAWADQNALALSVRAGHFYDNCDCGNWCCEGGKLFGVVHNPENEGQPIVEAQEQPAIEKPAPNIENDLRYARDNVWNAWCSLKNIDRQLVNDNYEHYFPGSCAIVWALRDQAELLKKQIDDLIDRSVW